MNKIKPLLFLLVVCAILNTLEAKNKPALSVDKPNIIIILADDLGYADVGFHGSDIKTPNLDKLANEGAKLENFHACPMCSPTRAGLMTGRYPLRFGMMRAVIPPQRNFGMAPSEYNMAEAMRDAGYNYRGCFGKWHLGHLQTQWHPINQGFTYFVGCYNGAVDYFNQTREGEVDWHNNFETVKAGGYTTDLITDAAVNFINEVPKEEPYFLYVPYTAPHSPFQAKPEDIEKYEHRTEKKKRIYAAMVDCMDQGIGEILKTIDERGDRDNTFILFFSDNGGVNRIADNSPMKGSKLTVYEGGIRVVAAAHWPNGGIKGGKIINEEMGYIDVLPTIAAVAKSKVPFKNELDGINVLHAMQGKEALNERSWFTYLDQNRTSREKIALTLNDRKLVVVSDKEQTPEIEAKEYELYEIDEQRKETKLKPENNKEIIERLDSIAQDYMKLKADPQIEQYQIGKEGFVAPKDWIIED